MSSSGVRIGGKPKKGYDLPFGVHLTEKEMDAAILALGATVAADEAGRLVTEASERPRRSVEANISHPPSWYWRRFWLLGGISLAYLAAWVYVGVVLDTYPNVATKVVLGVCLFVVIGGFLPIIGMYVYLKRALAAARLPPQPQRVAGKQSPLPAHAMPASQTAPAATPSPAPARQRPTNAEQLTTAWVVRKSCPLCGHGYPVEYTTCPRDSATLKPVR